MQLLVEVVPLIIEVQNARVVDKVGRFSIPVVWMVIEEMLSLTPRRVAFCFNLLVSR